MSHIKIITDTACDIPQGIADQHGIEILCFPITIDGKGYFERKDFSTDEFYQILLESKEIPVTSRINADVFVESYKKAAQEGVKDVIVLTINSLGSGTNESAHLALTMLQQENPGILQRMNVHIIDSKSYSYAYGYAAVHAAEMAEKDADIDEILEFMEDWLAGIDIYLACYNLDFAKKSGRISSAAAFVGELLGLRPVIRMVDGGNKVLQKVRGDKNVVPAVCDLACKAIRPGGEYIIMKALLDEPAQELAAMMEKRLGYPPVAVYKIGAAIAINAGPRMVAAMVRGPRRN